MDVLIIGGTQYFGKVIVRKLLDRGDNVTVFSRGNSRPEFWDEIEHINGDRTDYIGFIQKLKGRHFDAVVDNLAFHAQCETMRHTFNPTRSGKRKEKNEGCAEAHPPQMKNLRAIPLRRSTCYVHCRSGNNLL